MKLQIEQWISNNDFSENINVLFEDSVICYKSVANRASLLFSYLAFMTILKERIIGGVKPNLFPQGEWDVLIKKDKFRLFYKRDNMEFGNKKIYSIDLRSIIISTCF